MTERSRDHAISRRRFSAIATSGVAAAALHHGTSAQSTPTASPSTVASPAASLAVSATPDPNATFSVISPTREDVDAALEKAFPNEAPANTGGDMVQVFTSDITMLNPNLAQDVASGYITGLVYQEMVRINPADGTYRPCLADSWELASDGLQYKFHLNPDATWHDGKPVTAHDVIYSFDMVLAEDGFSPSQGTVKRTLASHTALDDKTVLLVAKSPSATFLDDTAVNVTILAKHIWENVPFSEHQSDPGSTGQDKGRVLGSGPFTFVEWVAGDHITLEKNADYWLKDDVPVLDRYIYRVVTESSSALQSLQTGEADVSGVTAALAKDFIAKNPDFKIHEYKRAHITYYETNLDTKRTDLFVDERVRHAMLHALDRDMICNTVYQGYAIPAHGSQPPLSPFYDPDGITSKYLFDVDKAKSLLDEAGWTPGDNGIRQKDGKPFKFEFTYEQDSATYQQLIPYLQQAWKDVGLEMVPRQLPFAAQQDLFNKRDYDCGLTGMTLNTTGNQGTMFRCDALYPDGYNEVMYCNEAYDALDDKQRVELDPEKRRAQILELANIVAKDLPMAPILFVNGLAASSPRLHNYFPSGYSSLWNISKMWVDAR